MLRETAKSAAARATAGPTRAREMDALGWSVTSFDVPKPEGLLGPVGRLRYPKGFPDAPNRTPNLARWMAVQNQALMGYGR